jgi:hypothetical protein
VQKAWLGGENPQNACFKAGKMYKGVAFHTLDAFFIHFSQSE